jgi:hypothetical protein
MRKWHFVFCNDKAIIYRNPLPAFFVKKLQNPENAFLSLAAQALFSLAFSS